MRTIALRVPRAEGERFRRRLLAEGILRRDLAIGEEAGWLCFPLTAAPSWVDEGASVTEAELRERRPPRARRYEDLVELPAEERPFLPRSFDVVGDVVVVRIPPRLAPRAERIGEALLRFVPGARVVAEDRGVHGTWRVRTLRVLAGAGGFETVIRENGLAIRVDVGRAYFSPRLAREHARVAAAARPGESVLDLCCGVGPFALTIARKVPGVRVTAVDANPEAIALLESNREGLGVGGRVEAFCRDAEEFLREDGRFDRIILNLPHDGARFLPAVGRHTREGGFVHYYEVVPRADRAARAREIPTAVGARDVELLDDHLVHEYSPEKDLRAYTLRRRTSTAG